VIHRDVKPSNILVDREGRARVVDFGLAFADVDPRALDDARRPIELTATGAMLGTPAYMAPEQFANGTIDARTDQWGLAVTLHEALVGRRPFDGDDLASLRAAITECEYVPPPDVPPHVRGALARALRRDPAARFGDTQAFVAALARADRRPRTARIGVAAIAALGLGGAAWASVGAPMTVEPAVHVSDLRALWSTPNAVRWAWTADGRADELRDYELVIGPTEADVIAQSDRTRVFDRSENPELGHFLLPRTGGADPVQATITDGHAPDEPVFARLVAIDTAGRRHESNVASIHTAPPAVAEIVVFDDELPSGAPMPDRIALSSAHPFAGPHHLQFESRCTAPECFANLRWQGLDVALDRLTPGDWKTTAYLELAVAIDGDATSWWSQLRIWCDETSLDHVGHFNSFALRSDGEYRVLQVPLRAFAFSPALDPADQIRHGLFEVGVGGWWPPGAIVRIDEIRVRW
jgi:hypothetical protein